MHAEGAHALARTGQTIVNVPDTTILKLYVDDEPFYLPTARLEDYQRVLDMQAGTLTRELVWATDAGKHVRVRSRRIVSLEHRHLVAMTYEVTMLDEAAPIAISSLVFNRQDAQTGDLPEHRRQIPAWPPCCRTRCSTCGLPSWPSSASCSVTRRPAAG